MALTINTNSSAATATMHLSKNNAALKKSLNRLSSGTRIVQPVDDAGGLAVSMKLESSIVRLAGAQKNIQNAQSFLEVQDGILSSAGKILNRMVELKGLSEDVMKNDSDKANYNREFQDLQMQIYDLAQIQFNGVSLFAVRDSDSGGTAGAAIINDLGSDNTLSVFASASGASGPTVSVNKAALLSALTIDEADLATGQAYQGKGTGQVRSFAAADNSEVIDLDDVTVDVFTQAIQNIATLRADNGGSMSRLRHASDDVALQKTNMIAANGRIKDVDIATESTNCLLYTSPSPRDLSTSRMPSSA